MANPTLLDMPIARDGNKNAIPTTDNGTTGRLSQQYGWQLINAIPPQQGGKAVKREDFNGALYLLSNLLFYLQKGWQFEWDSSQAYYAGCVVVDPLDRLMYECFLDAPASAIHPSQDPTHWKVGGENKGYRTPNTIVAVGDTATAKGIPVAYFLKCTTAGTTGSGTITVPTPVSAGQTITDGTVVWTITKALPVTGGDILGNLRSAMPDWWYIQGSGSNPASLALYNTEGSTLDSRGQALVNSGIVDGSYRGLIVDPTGVFVLLTPLGNRYDLGSNAILEKNLTSNLSWYIKYVSGFMIQGGIVSTTTFQNGGVGSSTSFALPLYYQSTGLVNSQATVMQSGAIKDVRCWSRISNNTIYIGTNLTNTEEYNISWVAFGV